MKILHSWLKQFVDLEDYTPQQIAHILTMSGLEVEHIETKLKVFGNLSGVVIGKVVSCEQHPNADKLKVCQVDIGETDLLSIVCGASNVAANQFVFVAKIGTTLYPIDSEPITIKKSKIRGLESWGMICAEDELGIGTSHEGIIILKDSPQVGSTASQYLNLAPDYVYEIGLTPNRTDAMGHWGVARELAALISRPFIPPAVKPRTEINQTTPFLIEIIEKKAVPKYFGVLIYGIKPAVTPDWIQQHLVAIGERCVNPIVDVTNFVLFESGQPLHAFDIEKLASPRLTVRYAKRNEPFEGLGQKKISLSAQDIVIADETQTACLAGILGGNFCAVDEQTTNIFLEAAYFEPNHIRKTARKLGLHTPASFRFERGCDPDMIPYALQRATELILEYFGGEATGILTPENQRIEPKRILFSPQKAIQLIGQNIPTETIFDILTKLGMVILSPADQPEWIIEVPHFRHDVTRFQDIVEELLRFYGLDNINSAPKLNASPVFTANPDYHFRFRVCDRLAGRGFSQILTNSLIHRKYTSDNSINLLNPLSEDLAILRNSLLPGILEVVAFNHNRKNTNLRIFEWGKTYFHADNQYNEEKYLTLCVTGNNFPDSWQNPKIPVNLLTIKGETENLLTELGIDYQWKKTDSDLELQDSLVLISQNNPIGKIGTINPELIQDFDIKQDVFVSVLNWEKIASLSQQVRVKFKEIPRFPSVHRDLSLVLIQKIDFEEIKKTVFQTNPKLIRKVTLFDKFQPKNQPVCYGISVELYDEQKTLTDARIEQTMQQIINRLEETQKIKLRS